MIKANDVIAYRNEAENHLINELLPFWTIRMKDEDQWWIFDSF